MKLSAYHFSCIYEFINDVKSITNVLDNCVAELETDEELAASGASWLLRARCNFAIGTVDWMLQNYIDSLPDENQEKQDLLALFKLNNAGEKNE